MHGVSTAARLASNKRTVQLADQMVSDDDKWFTDIIGALLPKDAGLALHVTTGFEERTCYRYAAGDRKPPAYFLRALLRSEQGWTWLAAVMDGTDAEWWLELQRARRIAEAISNIE
jgi:hypothetical protein